MKKMNLIALILFVAGLEITAGYAQPLTSQAPALSAKKPLSSRQSSSTTKEGISKKISLNLRDMNIVDVIKFLSVQGNLNIVTTKNVTGRVTLFLRNVTIGDILNVIVLTNNLAYIKKNNIITIMTEAEYEALYGERYSDNRKVKILKLKYALATKVGAALGNLKSSIGKIIMDNTTGTLILIDIPSKIAEMTVAANRLDKGIVEKVSPTVVRIFALEYAKAKDIKSKITKMLTQDIGSVRSDKRTNKVIVRDLPNKIKAISEMVTAFDTPPKEVFIDAKIVEITLNNNFAFGINWNYLFKVAGKNINLLGAFPASGITGSFSKISIGAWRKGFYTGEGTTSEKWNPGGLDPRKVQTILTFLRKVGKVKIVSSPHIAVLNNKEAKIMVGTRQPYATSTVSQSTDTSTTSWTANFVNVGITLDVTPTIYKGSLIKLHIKPEVSTLRDWFEIKDSSGVAQIRLPEVDTSNAETDVLIHNGRTIIIAGLIRESTNDSTNRTPLMSKLPFVGNLFRSVSKNRETKELAIFITPYIISGKEDIFYLKSSQKVRKPIKK